MDGEQRIMNNITGEIFKKYLPNDPELFLMDFIRSEHDSIIITVTIDDNNVFMTNINKETAKRLLKEIKRKHENHCLY